MQDQIQQDLLQQHNQDDDEFMIKENLDHHKQPTVLFQIGKEFLQQHHQLLAIHTVLKFIAALTLIILKVTLYRDQILQKNYNKIFDDAYLEIWIYVSCIHSLFEFIYCNQLLKKIVNEILCIQVAEKIGQLILIKIPETYSYDEKQSYIKDQVEILNQGMLQRYMVEGRIEQSIKVLIAKEIKKIILQTEKFLYLLGKGCFILFQFILLWGLIFYFHCVNSNQDLEIYTFYRIYLFWVVFLGIIQYFNFYIKVFLFFILLPINFYDCLNNYCIKRKERMQINDQFKDSTLSLQETNEENNNECAICMNKLVDKDEIIIITCLNKHRLHSTCVGQLDINNKCPLCREYDGETRQLSMIC
ncbi:unnamed protein product [Paramecium primaurelia]|uniref:RING-type domain-containing protein n=1 Tax=Paramecium primaurelia TaxID=5886 RepID=A0A8S1KYH6_PARPR|nr:unnamed protein product [Paramecium primaurelia]